MPKSKADLCKELFQDYLIGTTLPYKINLPRDLVFRLIGDKHQDFINENIIDVGWYFDKQYQTHPFSLYDDDAKKQATFERNKLGEKVLRHKKRSL